MKRWIKPIAIILVIAYSIMIPLSALAAVGSMDSSEAYSLMNKWKGYGILDKGTTTSDLSKPIQRIDFIMLINDILKASNKVEISFSDVPKDSWYGAEIAKAVAAGYVDNKSKSNYAPFTDITRSQAAEMAARVFELELQDQKIKNRISDAEKLDDQQLTYFASVVEIGGLGEVAKGKYAPLGVLKLADALKILDKCVGQLVTTASTITSNITGNLLVNTGAVTLKGISVTGNLIIAEGVGEGDIKLDGVDVKGKLVVRGGGPNSISLKNSRVGDGLFVEKSAGNVHVTVSGNTTVENTYLKSGGSLEEGILSGAGKGFVNITASEAVIDKQTAELKGNFTNVKVQDSNLAVKVNGNTETITISEASSGSLILASGEAKKVNTQASKNTIEILGGTVKELTVDSGAKGNKITINGTVTVNSMTLGGNTTLNITKGTVEKLIVDQTAAGTYVSLAGDGLIKSMTASAQAKVTGSGKITFAYIYANNVDMGVRPDSYIVATGISANIGGVTIDPAKPTVSFSSTPSAMTLKEGETTAISVSNIVPSGSTISYISSDSSIATVSSTGVVTGVSVGSTKIYVTGQFTDFNSKSVSVEVTVTSGNITSDGTLTINPSSAEAGTNMEFVLTYTAGDNMANGTVVIKLPDGFSVYETDTASVDGQTEQSLTLAQRPNIKTLSFTNLNLAKGHTIVVKLKNRVVPVGGEYTFAAVSDADGTGPKLPTSGTEKAVFTSNKLKNLLENINYSTPEYGSTGGTTKISTLSFAGFIGATKWIVAIQNGAFDNPQYDQVLTGTDYTKGSNITVAAGQHLLLAAVDDANKVKAYKDILVTAAMVRPNDAGQLVLGTNYNNPIPGVKANSVQINGLSLAGLDPAAEKWMIKVQNNASPNIFVNTEFTGAQAYTEGDDISVYADQHVVLAAVDSSEKIKAFVDITVIGSMISKPANTLVVDNNFSLPTYGSAVGTTKIASLNKGTLPGGFADIEKWMVVSLDGQAVTPAMDSATTEYQKYTGGKAFSEYTAGADITAAAGNHLLVVGVDIDGSTNKIKAYVDLTLDVTQIRQADAADIPDANFTAPEMGTTAGTTKIPVLKLDGITDASKFMVKVQNDAFAIPQMNSVMSGASDYGANQNIPVTAGQHLILLATDANGKIKTYKQMIISSAQIRPGDAMKLIAPNDYALPQTGTLVGTTKIVLSSNGISGFAEWRYKIGETAFEVPYKGSKLSDTTHYTSGADIAVNVGQHILILAVDSTGGTLAYTDEAISYSQIKQPLASVLKASNEVTGTEYYNYSVPEPGQTGGTTRITSLNTMGIQGATKWMYRISADAVAVPEYNSILSGLLTYIPGDSIAITEGKHFILYAVDSNNKIKAYRDITITQSQIRTPAAATLVAQTNYSAPVPGSLEGTTSITSLSYAGLDGASEAWSWRYVVGNTIFNAPTKDSDVNAISNINVLTTTTNITAAAGQYIMILAVDGSQKVKGYANVYVNQAAIRPYNAPVINAANYALAKGGVEGTTAFSKLDLIGIVDATGWMIKVQKDPFTVPAKDVAVTGSMIYSQSSNPNIAISVGWHILLLATDQMGRVKAYADLTVGESQIQAPFAATLIENTNYTNPEPGSAPGTVKIMVNDSGISRASSETILWKYIKSSNAFAIPHLNDDASGSEYTLYASNQDIPSVSAGNVILVVAVAKDASGSYQKIKAYRQFSISSSQIRPANAPELVADYNYTGPLAGSAPGTTKINDLKFIGILGSPTKWQYRISNISETLTLDSVFANPINYTSGSDIAVKMNQYVTLAAVDDTGKVKAYKCMQITQDSQLNPPLANKLASGLNYTVPKYGTATGTTSVYVSLQGINGATEFVAKTVNAQTNIIAGTTVSYTAASGSDYSDYHVYTTGADIAANPGQYLLLMAVDSSKKVLAYENLPLTSDNIRPGNAILLQSPQNYAALKPGAGVGTTKISELSFVGVPGGEKWIVKVQDADLTEIPIINSSVEGAVVYTANADIQAKEGQVVLLYAVDSTGKIKGYASIKVLSANVRGVAPLLKLGTDYSAPEPGSVLNNTRIAALNLAGVSGATLWKYTVSDSPAGTILKDSLMTGLTLYTEGSDISVLAGQHLILVATDDQGYVKAYADIAMIESMIRNVEAVLGGTVITYPTGESNIVAGGRTVSIQLKYGEWQEDVLSSITKRNTLYEGLIASGAEAAMWGKVVAALKNEGQSAAVMSSDKKLITITLSEAPTYDITENQEISLTIRPELIKGGLKAVTASNKISISANVIVQLDGTAVTQGLAEGDIKAGGKTIIIKLTNGSFALDVASNAAKRDAIFEGFKAAINTTQWTKVVDALKASGETAITRNASDKITLVLPAAADYDITMNDTVSLTLPYRTSTGEEILVGAIKDVAVATQLPVNANASANLTGTLLKAITSETNIVTGGRELIITLTDGQWVTDIDTDDAKRSALFAGLVATTETAEWGKVVAALKAAGKTAITRTDNNTVTILLPAVASYNISANQYISLVIPPVCIIGAKANLIAGQTVTVNRVASATLSGTGVGTAVDEMAIRNGSKTIIITLKDALWADTVTTDTTIRDALLDGFAADVEAVQWKKVIDNLKSGLGSIIRTSNNVITITLPATVDYDITSQVQNILLTIPNTAVAGTPFAVQATNPVVINNTPPVAAVVNSVNAVPPAGSYKLGDTVNITVKFNTAVDVIGTPVLNLETGTVDRNAVYSSGTGTDTLVFTYKVEAGDYSTDLDYKATTSLVLSGATIMNKGTSVKAITTLAAPGAAGSLGYTSNILVDAVAPKLSTGYPKVGSKTELTANILVKVDKKSKIYYVTVQNDITNATPTADQIITGLNAAGTPVADTMKGLLSTVENTEGTLAITGLTAYTAYTIYMVAVDDVNNQSLITAYNFTTSDSTAPAFTTGYPKQSDTKYDTRIDILIRVDGLRADESGKVYLVALPSGAAEPTSAQVKAFKNAGGASVATNLRATAAITADSEIALSVTALTVSTTYDIYVVCEDSQSNLAAVPAKVTASTLQLNLSNVGVDLSKKQITNTTALMEYSFDEINWLNCTASNTSITYDDNAEILVIYIREAANITNERQLPELTREAESVIDVSLLDYDIAAKKIGNSSAINLQYRINGGVWAALNALGSAANVEFVPGLLEVRTAASASKLPSAPVTVDNIAVPMPDPDLDYDDDQNVIYGLDTTYEYRIDGGTWTTGSTEGAFAGTKTVEVRSKATKDRLPSVAQVISFTAGKINPVAAPAASNTTLKKNYVNIVFEENTNKQTLTADQVRQYFLVGTWNQTTGARIDVHDWGTDISTQWNTAGNILTIVYNSMTGSTVKIGDEVRIDAAAGIKNAAGTSDSYTAKGVLMGSFHSTPSIVSIKAENANNTIGFNNGDRIVITFDQLTVQPAITAANIDTLLKVTDATGKTVHGWGVASNSDIVWGTTTDGTKTTLTITFNNVATTTLTLQDKVTVSESLGLTDADQTTEACSYSSFISGSFTSTPKIVSAVISNVGAAGTKNTGDIITITFDQATNKKTVTSTALINYFKLMTSDGKTAHGWGVQSSITWSTDGKVLTIKITSLTGLTLLPGDILTLNTLAGIKSSDGGTAACGDSIVVGGGY